MSLQLQSLAGLFLIPLLAWAMSERRRDLVGLGVLRFVAIALLLQLAVAGAMLNIPFLRQAFAWPGYLVAALQGASNEGMRFVFGYLAGGPAPFDVSNPRHGFVLAFQALPIILLVSVLSRLLYHWGILTRIVGAFAWVLKRTLGVGGPVGTSAAANIFVGMVEAPLLIRPYVARLSRADLFAVMTVGMATIAGTVLALYASVLEPEIPGAAGHLIVASVISIPAALLIAGLMVPGAGIFWETGQNDRNCWTDSNELLTDVSEETRSSMDAVAQGTQDGIRLLVSVIAMLVVMLALIALVNQLLVFFGERVGIGLSLEKIFGWTFYPLALLIGIPHAEAFAGGELLGIKTVINELVAFLRLAEAGADVLSSRSRLILTYALCGFANFGSLGILIGGLVAIAPERRVEIASLGFKCLVAGTLATLMTGAVVGVFTPP